MSEIEDPDVTGAQQAALLTLLRNGDDLSANIADKVDYHPVSINRACVELTNRGYMKNKGNGVYALTPSGVRLAQSIFRDQDVPPGAKDGENSASR